MILLDTDHLSLLKYADSEFGQPLLAVAGLYPADILRNRAIPPARPAPPPLELVIAPRILVEPVGALGAQPRHMRCRAKIVAAALVAAPGFRLFGVDGAPSSALVWPRRLGEPA